MKGRFIVVEGVNGVGKTTVLNEALAYLRGKQFHYSKGFTNNSRWDTFIHNNPHSFAYYIDLAWKTSRNIKPVLRSGIHVVQDRYVQTVDSFLPDCEWVQNKVFRRLLGPLFLQSDLYIHFSAEVDTVVERLRGGATDDYRLGLVAHPERIRQREAKYLEIYNSLVCPKHKLETTGRSPADCAMELVDVIRREIKC